MNKLGVLNEKDLMKINGGGIKWKAAGKLAIKAGVLAGTGAAGVAVGAAAVYATWKVLDR